MKLDYRDILTRAAWTFVQAAIAVLVVTPPSTWDRNALWAAALAGIAALLSMVKTVAAQQLSKT